MKISALAVIACVVTGSLVLGVYWLALAYQNRVNKIKYLEYTRELRNAIKNPHYRIVWDFRNKTSINQCINWNVNEQKIDLSQEVISWLDENCPEVRVMQDDYDLLIIFTNEEDKFHFKMRWM
jgi:hypothetical protein